MERHRGGGACAPEVLGLRDEGAGGGPPGGGAGLPGGRRGGDDPRSQPSPGRRRHQVVPGEPGKRHQRRVAGVRHAVPADDPRGHGRGPARRGADLRRGHGPGDPAPGVLQPVPGRAQQEGGRRGRGPEAAACRRPARGGRRAPGDAGAATADQLPQGGPGSGGRAAACGGLRAHPGGCLRGAGRRAEHGGAGDGRGGRGVGHHDHHHRGAGGGAGRHDLDGQRQLPGLQGPAGRVPGGDREGGQGAGGEPGGGAGRAGLHLPPAGAELPPGPGDGRPHLLGQGPLAPHAGGEGAGHQPGPAAEPGQGRPDHVGGVHRRGGGPARARTCWRRRTSSTGGRRSWRRWRRR